MIVRSKSTFALAPKKQIKPERKRIRKYWSMFPFVILRNSIEERIGIKASKVSLVHPFAKSKTMTTIPKRIPVMILCFKTN